MNSETFLSTGLVPDFLIRYAIRKRLEKKLAEENQNLNSNFPADDFIAKLRQNPIAVHTREANEQHYELPPDFFRMVLGKHLKYSCGFWPEEKTTLDLSEKGMLDLYAERAQIQNGQKVLELGCGWGSLLLYLAERFPASSFLGISNSNAQRVFITEEAERRDLKNINVQTHDINHLKFEQKFDRIVSIEMFEHLRNYEELFSRISGWLTADGLLFAHIFCHQKYAYLFEAGPHDWMGRYFFTGGIMPSYHLFRHFDKHLRVIQQWWLEGTHYEKTCNAWLSKMDEAREAILPVMKTVYGRENRKWFIYWRVFFMACAELFGYRRGSEWGVGHYLMRPNR